jgi:hypothetical protein
MAEVQPSSPVSSGEMAQRFVEFVMVQAQNILFVLGKLPTPEGGRMRPNLEAGKMLIDQLDMIRMKTQGNLTKNEADILEKIISEVSLAFVEASGGTPVSMMPSRAPMMEMPEFEEEPEEELPPAAAPASLVSATPAPVEEPTPPAKPAEPEQQKKFFKSYG